MEDKNKPQYMYQNKYQQVFHENSNCTILNDPQFHQPVTFNTGGVKGLPPHSQKIKDAIECVEKDGLLSEDILWWAIFRVLNDCCQFPNKKPDFCKAIDSLNLDVKRKCEYNNWRNVTPSILKGHVETWPSLKDCVQGSEKKQLEVGISLMKYLGIIQ